MKDSNLKSRFDGASWKTFADLANLQESDKIQTQLETLSGFFVHLGKTFGPTVVPRVHPESGVISTRLYGSSASLFLWGGPATGYWIARADAAGTKPFSRTALHLPKLPQDSGLLLSALADYLGSPASEASLFRLYRGLQDAGVATLANLPDLQLAPDYPGPIKTQSTPGAQLDLFAQVAEPEQRPGFFGPEQPQPSPRDVHVWASFEEGHPVFRDWEGQPLASDWEGWAVSQKDGELSVFNYFFDDGERSVASVSRQESRQQWDQLLAKTAPVLDPAILKPEVQRVLEHVVELAGGKERLHQQLIDARKAEARGVGGALLDLSSGDVLGRFTDALLEKIQDSSGATRDQVLQFFGIKEKSHGLQTATQRFNDRQKAISTSTDDLDPSSVNYRYRDTGYVAGSRKELAEDVLRSLMKDGKQVRLGDVDWESLETNPRAAKELLVKSNLFGRVDWAALANAGMNPGAGFLVDRVYASLASEPENLAQSRRDYVLALETLRSRLESTKSVDEVIEKLENIVKEMEGEVYSATESAEYQAASASVADAFDALRSNRVEVELLLKTQRGYENEQSKLQYQQQKRIDRKWQPQPEALARIQELEGLKTQAVSALAEYYNAHPETKKVDRTLGNGQKRFSCELEERLWSAREEADTIRKLVQAKNLRDNPITRGWLTLGPRFLGVVNWRRHNGSKTFAEHVALVRREGIKDWSWAEKDRVELGRRPAKESIRFQARVAESFDRVGGRQIEVSSTAALKQQFGLREVQSGNWVLRDVNAAKFHVEQCAKAFADLADLLGVPETSLSLGGRLALAFGARGQGAKGWASGAPAAHYDSVERVINLTKNSGGGSLAHEWFHAADNLLMEAAGGPSDGISRYMTESPNLALGISRDLTLTLLALHQAMTHGEIQSIKSFDYKASDVAKADYNIKGAYSGPGRIIRDAQSAERAITDLEAYYTRPAPSRSEKDQLKYDRNAMTWMKLAAAYWDRNPAGGKVMCPSGPSHSAFMEGAIELDNTRSTPYMSTTGEMAARAFQCYVEDTLANRGQKNDYLSVYADNKYCIDPRTGHEWKPFPEGDERQRINRAFDRLFEVVRSIELHTQTELERSGGGVINRERFMSEAHKDVGFPLYGISPEATALALKMVRLTNPRLRPVDLNHAQELLVWDLGSLAKIIYEARLETGNLPKDPTHAPLKRETGVEL